MGNILGFLAESRRRRGDHAEFWAAFDEYVRSGAPDSLGRIKALEKKNQDDHHWLKNLGDALGGPEDVSAEDRRALAGCAAARSSDPIIGWLDRVLPGEGPDQDLFGIVREAAKGQPLDIVEVARYVTTFERDGRPNSVGWYVLGLPDGKIHALLDGTPRWEELIGFLLDHLPDRLPPLLDRIFAPDFVYGPQWALPLRRDPGRYLDLFARKLESVTKPAYRLEAARALAEVDPGRFLPVALEAAKAALKVDYTTEFDIQWLVKTYGEAIIGPLTDYVGTRESVIFYAPREKYAIYYDHRDRFLREAVEAGGALALPVIRAAIEAGSPPSGSVKRSRKEDPDGFYHNEWDPSLRIDAIEALIGLHDLRFDDMIEAEIRRGLGQEVELKHYSIDGFVKLAAGWKPELFAEDLRNLYLDGSSDLIRDAAFEGLTKLGAEEVPHAVGLLGDRKGAHRSAAVRILESIGSEAALDALQARFDEETEQETRDAILRILDRTRPEALAATIRDRLASAMARVADRLKKPAAKWADEAGLPPLLDRSGEPLRVAETRYLFHRQGRAREIAPDPEARPLYDRIDPASGADFALAVLEKYLAAGGKPDDKWALTIAGRLGDPRVLPILDRQIAAWVKANRLKMAEYGIQALSLVADESALAKLDALALRYRVKPGKLGATAAEALATAADRLGVSLDDLGDRIVPRLGFEPGQARMIAAGEKTLEVIVGPDFKVRYRDPASGKVVASLPKAASPEVRAEIKELAARLKEVAEIQAGRLENLMVRQRRWPVGRWAELFLGLPVLFPFAVRLVWGLSDDAGALRSSFRALDDRTLTDAADDAIELPDSGTVGLVHPLDLDEGARIAWRTHLADHEVQPPFEQIDRPVALVPEERRGDRFLDTERGATLSALSFKGRAGRLGWVRGPVLGNGSVYAYLKKSPAGVDAVLELGDGINVTPDHDSSATLGRVGFFAAGTWERWYNPLPEADDPLLIPLGEVPPVVYSEVVGDLRRIVDPGAGSGRDVGLE